jgi:CDP-glycerol glycerophosphotransferase
MKVIYPQTWHGTPLKHIHFDSLWAPPGRVAYLTEDGAATERVVERFFPAADAHPRVAAAAPSA